MAKARQLDEHGHPLEGAPPALPSSPDANERYFGVDQTIHTLTLIHLTFHGLAFVGLTQIAISVNSWWTTALVLILTILAMYGVNQFRRREKRNQGLRHYWAGPDSEALKAMREYLDKFELHEHSRKALFALLYALYTGVGVFAILRKMGL